MVEDDSYLNGAVERLRKSLDLLSDVVEDHIMEQQNANDNEAELQRLNNDRSYLADELDKSQALAQQLERANREVSGRLITAMETIRTVLDR